MQNFEIKIKDFDGYAPEYYSNSWSAIGNKGQANSMTNIDITDGNILTQGPGIAALTAGTQAGSVTTLISSILKTPTSSDVAFACGGAKLYKISSSAVIATGGYPMTIDKGGVTGETATDIVAYQGNVYVFYNHSGSAGDIAKLTVSTDTLDPDFGCYSEDTEVLTNSGWKKFGEVGVGEKIPSLNIKTGQVEEAINTKTLIKPFNGEMINFKSRSCDLLVTTDHNIVASINIGANNWKPYQIIKAKDIENKKSKLIKTANWKGKIVDCWKIPSISNDVNYKKEELKIPIKTFLTFLGFYLSEGCCHKNGKSINIAQMRKSKGWNKIKECLDELKLLGLNYSIDELRGFTIYSKQLCEYVKSFVPGYCYEKYIPREILKLDKSLLFYLYESMMLGDGSAVNGVLCQYSTSSPRLKDTFEELINILGWSPTTNIRDRIGEKISCSNGTVQRLQYQISINRQQIYQTFNNNILGAKPKRQQYIGNIVCLVLDKNHTMLVRRNGKQVWCGNSTVPTNAAALQSAPHYAVVGGDDILYFTNGIYVGWYNGTTLEDQGLDFHTDSQTVAITWNSNRVIVGVNRPNITGSNYNQSAIYTWNGITSSWEGDPVEIPGSIGALYTKNGVSYIWYQDAIGTGSYVLGYISGLQVKPIVRYDGSLPTQAQVGEYCGFLMWVSNNKVMLWGSASEDTPTRLFHYMSGISATIGGIAAPFGDLLVASNATTNYNLGKESGYSIAGTYKMVVLPLASARGKVSIDMIKVITEQMSTGAKVDITLEYDQGKSTKSCTQIAYSTDNKIIHKILSKGVQCYDMRLAISFANGSTSNPVKIREVLIQGRQLEEN